MSLAEFLTLPEQKPALELFDGEVSAMVSPKQHHSRLQGRLVQWINVHAETSRLALAYPELRCTFAGSSVVPDVSVVRWERLLRDADGELSDEELLEPPDLAIEIRSPGQTISRLTFRCRWYTENGVALALLVDPQRREVRRYAGEDAEQVLGSGDVVELGPVLSGIGLAVDELFASLRPA
jgi:Uma2 family endonuclease